MHEETELQAPHFDLAISFAGEDRTIAAAIAKELTSLGFNIFYDEYFRHEMLGKDLSVYFAEIYSRRSRFCLILASSSYAKKAWTTHELRHAMAKQLESTEYILMLRLDQTPIPGFSEIIGFLDFTTVLDAVNVLARKLTSSLEAKQRTNLKRRINGLAIAILRYDAVVSNIDYSPDDDQDLFEEDDVRNVLGRLNKEYESAVDEYSRGFREYYDPLQALTRNAERIPWAERY